MMELIPVEIGLIPIFVAVLLGPLLIKRIERNLEAFLFLMGVCAVAVSRSWHIGIVEEAVQEPVVVGIVLSVLLVGLIAHYIRPNFLQSINDILLDRITMKVIFLEIVVVLGLLAAIITPILAFFVLVEAVNHLPLTRKTRAKITIFGMSFHFSRGCSCPGRWAILSDSYYKNAGCTSFSGLLAIGTAKPVHNY